MLDITPLEEAQRFVCLFIFSSEFIIFAWFMHRKSQQLLCDYSFVGKKKIKYRSKCYGCIVVTLILTITSVDGTIYKTHCLIRVPKIMWPKLCGPNGDIETNEGLLTLNFFFEWIVVLFSNII